MFDSILKQGSQHSAVENETGASSKLTKLAIILGALLTLSMMPVLPSGATPAPSGTCSLGGSVEFDGTKVSGPGNCLGGDLILSGVTEIKSHAFSGSQLTLRIVVPNTLHTIGFAAFYQAINLESFEFEPASQLSTIGEFAFEGTGLETFVMPDGVTEIPQQVFWDTARLRSVTLSQNLSSIGRLAFARSALTSIELPESLESIGESAFFDSSLREIEFPQNLISIGISAFLDSFDLVSVTFKGPAPTVGIMAFQIDNGGTLEDSGAQALVSRVHYETFTQVAGKWNGLEVVVPVQSLTLRSENLDLIQSVEFGAAPGAPVAVREGFNLVGWSTLDGGGTLLLPDLSDFVMGLEPTVLFAVWGQIPPLEPEEPQVQEPVQFSGPLVSSVDRRVFKMGESATVTLKGKRMHLIRSVSINGLELKIRSANRDSITLELPSLGQGNHSLLVISNAGPLSFRDLLSVR